MDRIIITGVKPYDGEYEFDFSSDTTTYLEWRWIKQISGYVRANVHEGWVGNDPDIKLAFAVIAMERAGRIDEEQVRAVADRISRTPSNTIRFEFEKQEETADPPVKAAETPPPNEQAETGGEQSNPTSESQGSDQSPTGHQGSLRSVTSDRLTSAG